jgi:hypothetical protein
VVKRIAAAGIAAGLALAGTLYSQDCRDALGLFRFYGNYKDAEKIVQPKNDTNQIVFARLIYNGQMHPYYKNWCTDYPEADRWLVGALRRLTNLDIAEESRAIAVTDPTLFKYPFIYSSEPGQMVFSTEDAAIMREYLERGGFWMLDDFWGTTEWNHVVAQMRRILPDGVIKDIPPDHPIYHTFYDIDHLVQTPSLAYAYYGITYEQDGFAAEWKGLWDRKGRLVAVMNHNTDLGDSYEHADKPEYPFHFSYYGYRIALNTILYALTH